MTFLEQLGPKCVEHEICLLSSALDHIGQVDNTVGLQGIPTV